KGEGQLCVGINQQSSLLGHQRRFHANHPCIEITDERLLTTDFFLRPQYLIRLHVSLGGKPALAAVLVKPPLPLGFGRIASGTFSRSGRRGKNLSAVSELSDIAGTTMRTREDE